MIRVFTVVASVLTLAMMWFSPAPVLAGRSTTVFISDLHMNLYEDYSWLRDNAPTLATFLTGLNARSDVAGVVILGDLVDDWVSPVANTPQTFEQVLQANTDQQWNGYNGVVPALQALCDNPDIQVTYVVGNHDMLSFQPANRAVLEAWFPQMTIVSESPGMGAYTSGNVIWAEHGHRYCLFNAPDTWSRSGGHLPLGYFISRLAATRSVNEGRVVTTPDVLDDFMKQAAENPTLLRDDSFTSDPQVGGVFSDAIIIAAFNGVALWAGEWPWSNFVMNGLDGRTSDPTVERVAIEYDSIYSGWPSRQNRVSKVEAVWDDTGHLSNAANMIFEMPDRIAPLYPFTPRIILFGHTHQAAFRYHSGDVETIYVNTGTWIDGKPMTWVEIATSAGANGATSYQVSLWFHGESAPRQQGTISVAAE